MRKGIQYRVISYAQEDKRVVQAASTITVCLQAIVVAGQARPGSGVERHGGVIYLATCDTAPGGAGNVICREGGREKGTGTNRELFFLPSFPRLLRPTSLYHSHHLFFRSRASYQSIPSFSGAGRDDACTSITMTIPTTTRTSCSTTRCTTTVIANSTIPTIPMLPCHDVINRPPALDLPLAWELDRVQPADQGPGGGPTHEVGGQNGVTVVHDVQPTSRGVRVCLATSGELLEECLRMRGGGGGGGRGGDMWGVEQKANKRRRSDAKPCVAKPSLDGILLVVLPIYAYSLGAQRRT